MSKAFVYAVVYDGYYPWEVDSIWVVEELAGKRATQLNKQWGTAMWEIVSMEVRREWDEGEFGSEPDS